MVFRRRVGWRGPVWFPVNVLIVQALHRYHTFYGDAFKVGYATRSGTENSLREIAEKLSQRRADHQESLLQLGEP